MVGATESAVVGATIRVGTPQRVEGRAPEPVRRTTEQIQAQEGSRMRRGEAWIGKLEGRNINLGENNGKKPAEILDQLKINQGVAGERPTPNSQSNRENVKEAQELYRELETEKARITQQLIAEGKPSKGSEVEKNIAAQARENVLANRIKAATPAETTPPKTPEELAQERKDAAEAAKAQQEAVTKAAELKAIEDATNDWVKRGALPGEARTVMERVVLGVGAARAQVDVATSKKATAEAEYKSAKTPAQQEAAKQRYAHAEQLLVRAQKELDVQLKAVEALRKNPKATPEDKLFSYDLDLALNAERLGEATETARRMRFEADKAKAERKPPYEIAVAEAEAKKAEEEAKSLTTTKDKLSNERAVIGSEDQRKINYVVGMVKSLTKGIPPGEGQSEEQQQAEIDANPLQFLQEQTAVPANLKIILESSGMSEKDQQKLRAIIDAEEVMKREAKANKLKGGAIGAGKMGMLLMLLSAWAAFNKNKKGMQGQG